MCSAACRRRRRRKRFSDSRRTFRCQKRSTRSFRGCRSKLPPVQSDSTVDFIVPVYNEAENIERALRELDASTPLPKRLIVVYDFDEDSTLPVVRTLNIGSITLVKNSHGKGVLDAIRTGIDAATGDVVIISMADLSDDTRVIGEMIRLIREEHYDIVCASRYMRGGRHIGVPLLKKSLSRLAVLTPYCLGAF